MGAVPWGEGFSVGGRDSAKRSGSDSRSTGRLAIGVLTDLVSSGFGDPGALGQGSDRQTAGTRGHSHTTTLRRTGTVEGPLANSSGECARMRSMSLKTARRWVRMAARASATSPATTAS